MRRLLIAVLTLACSAGVARGGDLRILAEPFGVSVQREPVNMAEPMFRGFVAVGENKLTFIIPERFSAGGDPAHGRLQLKTLEGDAFITLCFVGSESSGLTPEGCRDLVLEQYPGAKIVKQFTRPVAGHSAMVFDVEWKSESGFSMTTRASYFPTSCGNAQLTFTTGAKKFKSARGTYNSFVTTLAVSNNGKLAIDRIGGPN